MKFTDDYEVCYCVGTTYGEIVKAIKDGADSIEKIMDVTDAGSACGLCKCSKEDELKKREIHLDEILKNVQKQ